MEAANDILHRLEAAARAGRMDEAARIADQALAKGVRHPLPFAVLAQAALDNGRFHEAIALLNRAIALAPGDAALPTRLGLCLELAGRPGDAERAFDQALALAPMFTAALECKARLLRGVGREQEAEALFSDALKSDPANVGAWIGRAALRGDAGDWEASANAARRALALQPAHPDALWELARAALAKKHFAEARTLLERLLATPGPAPAKRWARTALGDALEGLGRHAEAFDAWATGKAELRALYAKQAAERPSETARIAEIAEWLETSDVAHAPADRRSDVAGHVFLTGFPRSGTTLLEQVLAAHAGVVTLEERPTLGEAGARLLATPEGRHELTSLDEAGVASWRRRYWQVVAEADLDPAGKVFVDKQPAGAALVPLLARLFPDAKVLFAIRDPRDVVLSCLGRTFQMNAFTYELTTLEGAARCYDAAMRLAEVCRAKLAIEWLDLRMEDLIADFEGQTRRLCEFAGLSWTPDLARFAEVSRQRTIRTPSAVQVRSGLSASSIGRWRAYRTELEPVLPILRPWVERYGYPAD